jgi:hypothetical protein
LRARHPVTRSSTRHVAFGVWAVRCAFLFGTWRAWLAASLHASRVAAFDVTRLVAKRTRFFAVANGSTRMPAVREVTSALLLTDAVFFLDDFEPFTRTALEAFPCTRVTTRLQGTTHRGADEMRLVDATVAWHCDLMITSRDRTLDWHAALDFCRILVLPAWQFLNVMTAWQFHVDVGDFDGALLVTLTTTLVLAIVVAAFLDPVAWFQAIDLPVDTFGVTLVGTRVSAGKALSTEKVTSSFRGNAREVIGSCDHERCLWVTWTT